MKVLGVGGLNHDPSVALLTDSGLAFAIESEKVTRHKDEIALMPIETIMLALEWTKTNLSEVDAIVTNWDAGLISNKAYLPQIAGFLSRKCSPSLMLGLLACLSASHT